MPYHHPTRARPQRIPGVARLLAACLLVCLWGASAGPAHAQARQATRTLEVAQVLPHSGPLANVGKEIHTITEAAFTDFNRSQAELQLRLLAADDGNVAQRSNELAAAMPRDIVAYLSCFGTVGCLAQQKAASVRGVPLIGPMAGAAPLRGPRSAMSYAVRASATRELQTLLTYMRTSGLQQVAVLVQDDGFGRAYADELRRQIPRAGDIGFDVHVFKPDAPAYRAVATRMQQRSPNALLLLANAAHSTGFLNAWRETQALPFVFNLAGQANALFASRLKGYLGAAAFVTVTPSPWSHRTALQRDYQRVAGQAQLPLSYVGFEAYINARLLIDSLQVSRARSAPELARYLDTLQTRDIGGFVIDYAQQRQGGEFTDLALLRGDGTFVH